MPPVVVRAAASASARSRLLAQSREAGSSLPPITSMYTQLRSASATRKALFFHEQNETVVLERLLTPLLPVVRQSQMDEPAIMPT